MKLEKWTATEIAVLRRLANSGKSAREIAIAVTEAGRPTTRNAIIGALRRNGIDLVRPWGSNKVSPRPRIVPLDAPPPELPGRPAERPPPPPRPERKAKAPKPPAAAPARPARAVAAPKPRAEPAKGFTDQSRRLPVADLNNWPGPRECRYIIGEPKTGHWCAAPTPVGDSWCPAHRALAYQPAADRIRRHKETVKGVA